jgi:hypothetical protein
MLRAAPRVYLERTSAALTTRSVRQTPDRKDLPKRTATFFSSLECLMPETSQFQRSAIRVPLRPKSLSHSISRRNNRPSSSYFTFPGPASARPGFAPVWSPSLRTCTPLTKTCFIPTAYWCGLSNVARSAIVAGSKTTTSANIPS